MEKSVYKFFFYEIKTDEEAGKVNVYDTGDLVMEYKKDTNTVICDFYVPIDHFGRKERVYKELEYNWVNMMCDVTDYFPTEVVNAMQDEVDRINGNGNSI